MKKYKTTLIALLVLVAVAAAFVTVLVLQKDKTADPQGNGTTDSSYVSLLSIKTADVIGFESKFNEIYTIEKYETEDGKAWRCTSDESLVLYESSVNSVVSSILSLHGTEIKDVEDYTDYGFTDGRSDVYVKLYTADGGEEILYVGNRTPNGYDYYVVVAGTANTVYRVSTSYATDLMVRKQDLINLRVFTFSAKDTMEYFLVNKNGEKCLELRSSSAAEDGSAEWSVRYPLERAGENSSINELINSMRNLSLGGIHEEACEDLSVYGLDVPAIEYYLRTSDADGNATLYWIRVGQKTESGSEYYCTVDETGDVYTVSTKSINRDLSAVNYMSRFIFLEDSDNVARVDFELSGERYEMRYEYETVIETDEKTGEEKEVLISTRYFNGKEAPDDDDCLIVSTKGYNYVPFTEEHRKLNKDDNYDNDVSSANPYECFNHLLAALYANISLNAVELEEPSELGEKIMTVKYTRVDGSTVDIELYKRDNTTAWIYANGTYAGGYCRTTSIFGNDYEKYDIAESIVALKAVMALLP